MIGGLISGAMNIMANSVAQNRQQQYNQENMYTQYALGERAANAADARARAQYYDMYSPESQYNQLKMAGLSPGLFYSHGSTSGTGGQGQFGGGSGLPSVGMPSGNYFDINQSRLAQAEIELKTAEKKKIEEETRTEAGENERGQFELENLAKSIDKMAAETDESKERRALYKTETAFQEAQTNITKLQYDMQKETYWDTIDSIRKQGKLLAETLEGQRKANNLTDAQFDELKKQVKLQNRYLIQQIWTASTNRQLTEKEIENMEGIIARTWNEAYTEEMRGKNEQELRERWEKEMAHEIDKLNLEKNKEARNQAIGSVARAISEILGIILFKKAK